MSNSSVSERTCVVCREKKEKKSLFRIAEKNGKLVFDADQKVQSRGFYVCKTHECVKRLSLHKKYKIAMEELVAMAKELKKEQKNYLDILSAMKNSEYLTFGINMVFEDIEKVHFLIIAEDISPKNDGKIIRKAKEHNIKYVHYGTKKQLGELFGKVEVNLVGVINKKVARGFL